MDVGRLKNYQDNKERYKDLRERGICVWCGINKATTSPATGRKVIKYCEYWEGHSHRTQRLWAKQTYLL